MIDLDEMIDPQARLRRGCAADVDPAAEPETFHWFVRARLEERARGDHAVRYTRRNIVAVNALSRFGPSNNVSTIPRGSRVRNRRGGRPDPMMLRLVR
jgi:hypothetical protein